MRCFWVAFCLLVSGCNSYSNPSLAELETQAGGSVPMERYTYASPDLDVLYGRWQQSAQSAEDYAVRNFGAHTVYQCKATTFNPDQYSYCLMAHGLKH